ncbi:MAG TPA: AAA family ATPase [Actinomycetota bacterium]|nr:AAA family ATPase [Actinomycetota bacterium]
MTDASGGSADPEVLAPALGVSSPLALHAHRSAGSVVGRSAELDAIGQEIASALTGRLVGLTLEGEPGIGKTRLLLAAREVADRAGMVTIAVTADEEIRGPFLLARSILGSREAVEAAAGGAAEAPLARCLAALSGQDDPALATLPADQRVLRTFDLGAIAFRALSQGRGLAVLIDDAQWCDDDSLRLLRYAVRADAADPILLFFTVRPAEFALVTEAVNLVADMDRMGVIRRLKPDRFTPAETGTLLRQVLGGPVDPASASVMHGQAEGVPFIVEEMASAYREAGMIQEIDGTWTLARNAERLVPSAVRTLISRRAARLPEETTTLLAEAAVLGRHFSLKDLREIEIEVRNVDADLDALAASLAPAVTAGLLLPHTEGSPADYSFPHEQVQEFAMDTLLPERRRAIHAAIVGLLMAGEPAPASLPLLARHAKAAGDAGICVRFSVAASRNALAANAPEEVLRMVELSLPLAATPRERVDLLEARDRALEMLRRPDDRMQGLAELSALAEAMSDAHLEVDVRLRRAAALRMNEEDDRAAQLAREVMELAASRNDREGELAACIELGQDLLRSSAGETYTPAAREVDLEGAEAAYRRALAIARDVGDDASTALVLRELGVIALGWIRDWFINLAERGEHLPILMRAAQGEALMDILSDLPIVSRYLEARDAMEEALELFERVGDRRGAMSTVIAMGYLTWAADIHFGAGAGRHIEEIRRLTSRMTALTTASDRATAEAQMLYGVHVFARGKVIPDLAVSRGEEAFREASGIGDPALSFLAAGGTAMAYLDLGEHEAVASWLDRAAAVASANPTPLRARRMETWRGLAAAARGDTEGMRGHLERAVALGAEDGRPASRCGALAELAGNSAELGSERGDVELLELAEGSANEVLALSPHLSGHPPWPAQADAALATVTLARGDQERAAEHARSAFARLNEAKQEDPHLSTLLPLARVLRAVGAPEAEAVLGYVGYVAAMVAQRTLDESIRVRWFRGPLGRQVTELIGASDVLPGSAADGDGPGAVDEADRSLLRSLVRGRTNAEIAGDLGIDEDEVVRRLGELFATIGASSRAEATAFAFRQEVV